MVIKDAEDEFGNNLKKLSIPEGALPDFSFLAVTKSKWLYMGC